MSEVTEKVVIANQAIELKLQDILLERLILDDDNPRIRYRLRLEQNGKSLDEVINEMPEVAALRKDIKTNGGLRERIIVKPIGDGSYKVVEGNVRFTCISSLHQTELNDNRWKSVPARVLPDDVTEVTIAILLSDQHVAGKIQWKAHEKAGQIHHMKKLGIPPDEIAIYLRTSKSAVNQLLQAYAMMSDIYLAMPEYRDKGEGKFTFFLTAFQIKRIREKIANSPGFKRDLCRWIGEGKIPEVTDMKRLPDILERPSVRKQFIDTAPVKTEGESPTDASKNQRQWFENIYKIVQMDEPEKGTGPNAVFHRALQTFNQQIETLNVSDLKEMENDEVLHRRINEFHENLLGFMSKIGLSSSIGRKKAS